MANRNVYQQKYVITVPRDELLENIILDDEYSKKDLRVFLLLLTELSGFSAPSNNNNYTDPNNFTKIDSEQIAITLSLKRKDVVKSINKFLENGVIERGDTSNLINGYRFTF